MARYDGLIIPRSYNEYINKTDPIAMSQALQLNGVMDNTLIAGSVKPITSGAVYTNNVKSSIGRYLNAQGWYKIYTGSIRSAGVILNIMLGTIYNYEQNSSHDIHFAYGYKNANMTETVRDIHEVFNKIRFYYRDDNIKNCEVYVSYSKNTSQYVFAKINSNIANISNTANVVVHNFVATDVSQLDNNYVEYSLGTDGFYINGEKKLPTAPATNGAYNLQCTVENGVPTYSWRGIVDGATVRNLGGVSTYTITLPKAQKYRVLRGVFIGAENKTMAFEISYGQGYTPNYRMSVPDVSFISDKLTMTYDRYACTITFSSSSEAFYACIYSIQAIEAYLGLPVTV